MIRGFYAGASALTAQQTNLDTIAANLANTGTSGFKPQETAFASLLYKNVNGALPPISVGHGVRVVENTTMFAQGTMQATGRDLDFAIQGDGFFALEDDETGELSYTRDGNFQYQVDGKKRYFVNASGKYLLNTKGDRLELDEKKTLDTKEIGVYSFSNNYGLNRLGDNSFGETESSGEADAVEEAEVLSGYLESSKVDMSREMVKMIEASKAFSINARVVTTADEIEQITNQLR